MVPDTASDDNDGDVTSGSRPSERQKQADLRRAIRKEKEIFGRLERRVPAAGATTARRYDYYNVKHWLHSNAAAM